MHHRTIRAAAAAAIAALALTALAAPAWAENTDGPVEGGVFVDKIDGLSPDFLRGVDVSTVLSLEESGVVFRDEAGNPADLFTVLADNGVNSVRVRVWNDPYDAEGNGYGGGTVDVERAVEIGKRATAAGMGVLVDFHYSDFWADPARQLAPKAWQGLSDAETVTALHDFTADALQQFEDAGVDVTMVQVGNETNNGIAGHSRQTTEIDAQFAALVDAGATAVREVLPESLVAVHFTNPETPGRYATYAAGLEEFGVDYDVFASSYYPYWHGTTENLTDVLTQISESYDKQVIVAETSWARTLEDGDGYGNVIGSGGTTSQYPVSVQGQAWQLHDVIEAVAAVGDAGIGVYYWEPAWLPVGPADAAEQNSLLWEQYGSGWASSFASDYDPAHVGDSYGGSAWDNQSLFGWDGKPLESLRTFEYVYTGATAPLEVVSVEKVDLDVVAGEEVVLPDTVDVTYNDGSVVHDAVTWSDAADWIRGSGVYEIPGVTASGQQTVASVEVAARNYVVNGGFEDADMSAWTLTAPAARQESGDAFAGEHAVTFWNGWGYEVSVSQTITGVPAGEYVLRATTQGTNSPAADTRTLSATTSEGEWSAPLSFSVWNAFDTATVEGVVVGADGTVEVSADFVLTAGAWGVLDEVQLIDVDDLGGATPTDKSTLEQSLTEAKAVDTALYTEESVAALADAIATGDVVMAGSLATVKDVRKATKIVDKAVAKLVAIG